MINAADHIIFLCSRLDLPGGIERAIVNTAGLFCEKGHRVTLLVLDETDQCYYPIHPGLKIVQQPLSFGITKEGNIVSRKIKMLSDVLSLRKTLRQLQPTLIIATEYPFAAAAVLCGAGKRAPVWAWEHHHFAELKRNAFWERIFRYSYPRLTGVVCLNEDEKRLYSTVSNHCRVIPNFISRQQPGTGANRRLLTVARLVPVKGPDLLARVSARVLPENPGWTWKLIGSGEALSSLQSFIRENGLEQQLILQSPAGPDIISEYEKASIYVMTSRHECFPMTLLEAQAAGLPCVAFDCDTGPRHLIQNEINGYLAPDGDVERLAALITMLIRDDEKRKQMAIAAYEQMLQFSPEAVYEKWKAVIC